MTVTVTLLEEKSFKLHGWILIEKSICDLLKKKGGLREDLVTELLQFKKKHRLPRRRSYGVAPTVFMWGCVDSCFHCIRGAQTVSPGGCILYGWCSDGCRPYVGLSRLSRWLYSVCVGVRWLHSVWGGVQMGTPHVGLSRWLCSLHERSEGLWWRGLFAEYYLARGGAKNYNLILGGEAPCHPVVLIGWHPKYRLWETVSPTARDT